MSYPIIRRGFSPTYEQEFSDLAVYKLTLAANDLEYLLDRGYSVIAACDLVGNRYQLTRQQRHAVKRVTDAKSAYKNRKHKEMTYQSLTGHHLHVDGFNTIISLETAISRSPVFLARDGTIRDLAGLRGSYRIIDKTKIAIRHICKHLESAGISRLSFILDQQVSNSGRLAKLIREETEKNIDIAYLVDVIVTRQVDQKLQKLALVSTSDSAILDRCQNWYNLTASIIETQIPEAWVIKI